MRPIRSLIVVAVAATFLIACGDDDDSGGDQASQGGGEVVYHASVSPSQGSFGAREPGRWRVFITLKRKTRIPTAITYEPRL